MLNAVGDVKIKKWYVWLLSNEGVINFPHISVSEKPQLAEKSGREIWTISS